MELINFIIGGLFIISVFVGGVEYGSYTRAKESKIAMMFKEFKQ